MGSRQTENLSKEIVASEIKNLEEMIQLNEKITGIQFTTTNWTPVKQEGMVLTRRHFMEGFCCEKTFQLTYDIEEDFSQSDQGMALTDLTLYVEDDIGAAISNHLEQLTETDDINIQGFFTMLPSYLAWKREQDEAITGLLQEYSEFVEHRHQDNVHTLVISNPNINRPSFVLDWDFKVDHFKKIERDFQLAVKVPHKMLNHDNHKVLASTPEMFMKVLKKAGPKNAVTMLVKMVSGQADTQD